MSFILESAARETSGVAHVASTFAQIGAVGGGAIAAVLVIGTGGLGAAALAALAWGGTGSFVGGLLDGLSEASVTERLCSGSPDVFVDEPKLAAANASPATRTDGHGDAVETGSDSVFIDKYPASRVTDKVLCGGVIKEGAAHVFYGGSFQASPKGPSKDEPTWLWAFNLVSSVAGLRAPTNAWEWVSTGSTLYGIGSGVTGASNDVADQGATAVGLVDTMRLVAGTLAQ